MFLALAALAGGGGRGASTHQTHEMTVPNEIIGCVIGKGGSKIAEIRWVMIDISCENTLKYMSLKTSSNELFKFLKQIAVFSSLDS